MESYCAIIEGLVSMMIATGALPSQPPPAQPPRQPPPQPQQSQPPPPPQQQQPQLAAVATTPRAQRASRQASRGRG